jgi:hypothetical protein
MSLSQSFSESMPAATTEDNFTSCRSGETLDDDDEDSRSSNGDSSSGSETSESDDETEDEEEHYREEEEDDDDEYFEKDDDVSFLVPIEKNRSPTKAPRSELQQAQQRRLVLNLAASSTQEDDDISHTEGGTTTDVGYTTTASEDTADSYEEGDYSTTQDDGGVPTLSTGDFGASTADYSVASQSTATTQPTSPSRKKKHLTLDSPSGGKGGGGLEDLTTPDFGNPHRVVPSASTTPRTGHTQGHLLSAWSPRPERIPGGAAAKLMLLGPKGSKEGGSGEDMDEAAAPLERMSSNESAAVHPEALLAAEFSRVQQEFCTGQPKTLDRNKMTLSAPLPTEDNDDDVASEVSKSLSLKPSFLNRSEVFHSSAADAVAALLRPRHCSPIGEEAPKFFSTAPDTTTAPVRSSELMDPETERKLLALPSQMLEPTPTLTDLLTAIATPDGPIPDPLAFSVRRKNACGALLTLTSHPHNRVRIGNTMGVLTALKSVLADGLRNRDGESVSPFFPEDDRIRAEYDAARFRALSALMNLSLAVPNRLALLHSPGLVAVLLEAAEQDAGAIRKGATAILAALAKTREHRRLLAQIPGLLDLVRTILQPRPARMDVVAPIPLKPKPSYPWSEDEETSTSSSLRDASRPSKCSLATTNGSSSFRSSLDQDSKVEGGAPREVSGYDATADDFLQAARQNVFALLGHLVKEKDNAYHLAHDIPFVSTMVEIAQCQESPSHALAVKILAHLTRHRLNKILAFKPKTVVPALVLATQSTHDDARLYACYALQNLSQEKSCRQELAIAERLIEVLCDRCRNGTLDAERLAAVSCLKNLCDEPANLIPLTNTTGCVTTLLHLAQAAPSGSLLQYRAADALATLSHWLRKIATSGHSLDATQKGRVPGKGLFVPSLREVSWQQWM